MNAYGDISMWRDLGFLREVSERVRDWGASLQMPTNTLHRKGKEREREREREGQTNRLPERIQNLPNKEMKLKKMLGWKGIELLYLPQEMDRHKTNQSAYNQK